MTPQIYLVGGAVRDTLLQRPVKDRDYVLVGGTEADIIAKWPSAKRDQDAKMTALAAVSPLPHSPDREAIGTLCEALLREGLGLQGCQGVRDVN